MSEHAAATFFPLISIFFYLVPIIFIIWFLVKFINIQQERNKILHSISEKLDQLNK